MQLLACANLEHSSHMFVMNMFDELINTSAFSRPVCYQLCHRSQLHDNQSSARSAYDRLRPAPESTAQQIPQQQCGVCHCHVLPMALEACVRAQTSDASPQRPALARAHRRSGLGAVNMRMLLRKRFRGAHLTQADSFLQASLNAYVKAGITCGALSTAGDLLAQTLTRRHATVGMLRVFCDSKPAQTACRIP